MSVFYLKKNLWIRIWFRLKIKLLLTSLCQFQTGYLKIKSLEFPTTKSWPKSHRKLVKNLGSLIFMLIESILIQFLNWKQPLWKQNKMPVYVYMEKPSKSLQKHLLEIMHIQEEANKIEYWKWMYMHNLNIKYNGPKIFTNKIQLRRKYFFIKQKKNVI